MDPKWVLDIRDQCKKASVPFFFKQWGGTRKKKAGRVLEGRTWDEMPELSRQEYEGNGLIKKAIKAAILNIATFGDTDVFPFSFVAGSGFGLWYLTKQIRLELFSLTALIEDVGF